MNEFISNSPHGKDFFEGKSQQLVAKAIYESINNVKNLPHIIGLEGDWGSGKSNVIKQLSDISGLIEVTISLRMMLGGIKKICSVDLSWKCLQRNS